MPGVLMAEFVADAYPPGDCMALEGGGGRIPEP